MKKWQDGKEFDRWANKYDTIVRKEQARRDWMYRDYDKILDTLVEYSEVTKNDYILDIGTGTGTLLGRFLKLSNHVYGIDPSIKMIEIARKKFPEAKSLRGHFLQIPFKNLTFDIICSAYAFHHLTEIEKALAIKEMKKKLSTRGRVVIADIMFKNPSSKHEIVQNLLKQGKMRIVEEMGDEYFAYYDVLKVGFEKEGFVLEAKKITDFVWAISAKLYKNT